MTKQIVFFALVTLMILYGSIFTMKYFGWPSTTEHKNKVLRAVKTGFSSTLLVIGLMLLYFYAATPNAFWSQWTAATIIGGLVFLGLPILGLMTVVSFIQFSIWEKTQSLMITRLKKITRDSTKEEDKSK